MSTLEAQLNQYQTNINAIISAFECPVCFSHVMPPIYQCQSGHLVCSTCQLRITRCPTCRGPFSGNTRNLALEKVAEHVMFPCKFASNGCTMLLQCSGKNEHELACNLRPYCCPISGNTCRWQGNLDGVASHVMSQHQPISKLSGDEIQFMAPDIDVSGYVEWTMIQSCFGYDFLLTLEKHDKRHGKMYFGLIQLIGTVQQAENFIGRMELNGIDSGIRLSFENAPRSIQEGQVPDIRYSNCLVFNSTVAQLFAKDGELCVGVKIFPKS